MTLLKVGMNFDPRAWESGTYFESGLEILSTSALELSVFWRKLKRNICFRSQELMADVSRLLIFLQPYRWPLAGVYITLMIILTFFLLSSLVKHDHKRVQSKAGESIVVEKKSPKTPIQPNKDQLKKSKPVYTRKFPKVKTNDSTFHPNVVVRSNRNTKSQLYRSRQAEIRSMTLDASKFNKIEFKNTLNSIYSKSQPTSKSLNFKSTKKQKSLKRNLRNKTLPALIKTQRKKDFDFFQKMVKLGVPLDRVLLDVNQLDPDEAREIRENLIRSDISVEKAKLHKENTKYDKMRRLGIPEPAIQHAMKLDYTNGLDLNVTNLKSSPTRNSEKKAHIKPAKPEDSLINELVLRLRTSRSQVIDSAKFRRSKHKKEQA